MPVLLEAVTQPSAQDRTDLLKVLADWPDTLPALHEADTEDAAFLDALLADPGQQLLGGRFNGRLIALAWLEASTDNSRTLHALCVRKLTRGRGVGKRLLTLLTQQLDETGCELICELPVPLPTRAWMGQYGFREGSTPNRLLRPAKP